MGQNLYKVADVRALSINASPSCFHFIYAKIILNNEVRLESQTLIAGEYTDRTRGYEMRPVIGVVLLP